MFKEIKEVDPDRRIIRVTTTDERWYVRPKANATTGLPSYEYVPSSTWISSFYPKGTEFYKWLASKGWNEAEALKESAGDRGTRIHHAIEDLLRGVPIQHNAVYDGVELSVDEYWAVMTFKSWWKTLPPDTELLGMEYVVWNKEHGYAGTVDLKLKIGGLVWIIDIKSSKSVWPEHILQVSSYRHADACDKTGIIQVGYQRNRSGFKFTEIEDKFNLFLAAKTVWENECGKLVLPQREYPLEIKLND